HLRTESGCDGLTLGLDADDLCALRCALEVEVRKDAVEPPRKPPVGPAEEAHGRRHEDHAHKGGVEEHSDREADTEQLAVRAVRSVTMAWPVSETVASVPDTVAGSTSERR